jgi:hypothetical protein
MYELIVSLFQPCTLCHVLYKELAVLKEAPILTMTSLGFVLCKLATFEFHISFTPVKYAPGRLRKGGNKERNRKEELGGGYKSCVTGERKLGALTDGPLLVG